MAAHSPIVNTGRQAGPSPDRGLSPIPRKVAVSAIVLFCVAVSAAQTRPARIISLVPAVTETLFAIGAGPRVVAVSSYDREPPEVRRLPSVGALLDPDLERMLALRPDLVAIYASQQDLRQQLDRAGVPVFPYVHGGLADVTATITALGAATGEIEGARALVDRISRQLDEVRRRVSGRARPRTLLVFGRAPGSLRNLYASGGYGFLHDMLMAAGGENVFADVHRESVQASTEMILARRPDVILELRAEGEETPDAEAWNALPAIPAVRSDRVIVLTGSDLVVPGPRVGTATERLARALHPGAYR